MPEISTDFILIGTARDGLVNPETALLPSLHNPHRCSLESAVLVSDNRHATAFVLVSRDDSNECFDVLEETLLRKAAFRSKRAARTPEEERTHITYVWRMVEPDPTPKFSLESQVFQPRLQVDADLVDDQGLTGKADAAPDTPTSVMGITDYVFQKNGNKFGTPLPARRGSESVDASKTRGERSSNDSVMVDLVL